MIKFKGVLTPTPRGGGGTLVPIPEAVAARLGLKGMPKVQAVIAGTPYRGSLMPMGDGTYCLGVLKSIQEAAGVEIFDQAYNLRGSDPEYILKLAEYVDAKMRAVAEATNTIDTVRLAVLAALNIADEYHLLKRSQNTGATDYQKRAHLLASALDEVLEENRKAG